MNNENFTRGLVAVLACGWLTAALAQTPPAATPRALTLDDLFAEQSVVDAAVSPSGKYISAIVRRAESDLVVLMDADTRATKVLTNIGRDVAGKNLDVRLTTIQWKSEDRILFHSHIKPDEIAGRENMRYSEQTIMKMGIRLFAIGRDGGNLQRLMGENAEGALDGTLNLGRIASLLVNDPDHVMLVVSGRYGGSLWKVNVNTGEGVMVEKPRAATTSWWLDIDGRPILREEYLNGSIRILRPEREGNDKWKVVLKFRPSEYGDRPDYEQVGPADASGNFFVIARPEGSERRALYTYNIEKETFSSAVIENAQYDLDSATISRDGKRVIRHCHMAHVRVCEFTDKKIDSHMRGLRRFFKESANVYITDSSADDKTIVLFVEGPSEPPSFYYYRVDQAKIEPIGAKRDATTGRLMPSSSVVRWKARDGLELSGYLIRPPGAEKATKLPLVIMPHGGPEARDILQFDTWTQAMAARGYAVFLPNFRGSDGFGRSFAERGHGEWGGKMQDDLVDGLDALIADGTADAARVCIVGASYGGYAALAGATQTPDRFRCAVSIAGISDLPELLSWRRIGWDRNSEAYLYLIKMLGDPERDAAKLASRSPARFAAAVKAPVLLIHGEDDDTTPLAQSEMMKKALDKAGKKAEFIRLAQVGHRNWPEKTERRALTATLDFLTANLGP
jgi:dienelactone hydrolase